MLPSVGVFGTDQYAQLMIKLFKNANFNVTMVCGTDSIEDVRRTAEQHDIPNYTKKKEELLVNHDVGLVCVSSSPRNCAEISVKALKLGKHVFASAPSGLKTKEATEMVRAAQYYPVLLSLVNHPLRFLPAFTKAKELIVDEYIGRVFLCECTLHTSSLIGQQYDWHCDVTSGGGVLQTYGSHIIDVLTFLLDERAAEVQGLVETFTTQTAKLPCFRKLTSDDFSSFHLKYRSGVRACVTLNSNMPDGFVQQIRIVGTKGYLNVVNCDLYGQLNSSPTLEHLYVAEGTSTQCESSSSGQTVPDVYARGLESLIGGIKLAFESIGQGNDYFLEFFAEKRLVDLNVIESAANFMNGWYTRSVLDAILLSNKERRWITVEELEIVDEEDEEVQKEEQIFWHIRETLLRESAPSTPQNTGVLPRKPHGMSGLRRIISQPVIYKKDPEDDIAIHENTLDVGRLRKITETSEKSPRSPRKITEIMDRSPRLMRRITETAEKSPRVTIKTTENKDPHHLGVK